MYFVETKPDVTTDSMGSIRTTKFIGQTFTTR